MMLEVDVEGKTRMIIPALFRVGDGGAWTHQCSQISTEGACLRSMEQVAT
jgi:hypothetical protein